MSSFFPDRQNTPQSAPAEGPQANFPEQSLFVPDLNHSSEQLLAQALSSDLKNWRIVGSESGRSFVQECDQGILVLERDNNLTDVARFIFYRQPRLVTNELPAVERHVDFKYLLAIESLEQKHETLKRALTMIENISPFDWQLMTTDMDSDAEPFQKSLQSLVEDTRISLSRCRKQELLELGYSDTRSDYTVSIQVSEQPLQRVSSDLLAAAFEKLILRQELFEQAIKASSEFSLLDWKFGTSGKPADDCMTYRFRNASNDAFEIERRMEGDVDRFTMRVVRPDSNDEFIHPDIEELFDSIHESFQERRKSAAGRLTTIISDLLLTRHYWMQTEQELEKERVTHFSTPIDKGRIFVARHSSDDGQVFYSLQVTVSKDSELADISGKIFQSEEARGFYELMNREHYRKLDVLGQLLRGGMPYRYQLLKPEPGVEIEHFTFQTDSGRYRVVNFRNPARDYDVHYVDYIPPTGAAVDFMHRSIFSSREARKIFEHLKKAQKRSN